MIFLRVKALAFFFLFPFFFLGFAQIEEVRPGKITDSVPVTSNSDESYALYLPKDYDPQSLSPIVFIFDPAGQGATGLKPFMEAAVKYSYILVCSNDSKNGPYSPNLKIADRLFKGVLNSYSIDHNRIYTAGFSGGSRLAATIAVLSNGIRGVIACGAGFSKNPMYFPNLQNTFSYAALVGYRDMNYQEMKKTMQWVSKIGLPSELFLFDGEHQWPPSEVIIRTFDWLQNEALRQGLATYHKEQRHIDFERSISLADSLERKGRLQDAVQEYERLSRNYMDLIESEQISSSIQRIRKQKAFKKAEVMGQRVVILEDSLTMKFLHKLGVESLDGESPDDFKWWKNQLKRLDKKYSQHKHLVYRDMAYRINRQLFAVAIESFDSFILEKNEKEAFYCEELLMVIAPKNPFVHYQMARRYAAFGKPQKSLEHLKMVLSLGWDNKELILNTREFSALRQDPDFISLLNKLQ